MGFFFCRARPTRTAAAAVVILFVNDVYQDLLLPLCVICCAAQHGIAYHIASVLSVDHQNRPGSKQAAPLSATTHYYE